MRLDKPHIEHMEPRRLMHASLAGTDVLTVTAKDGTKENANDIVVRFTGSVESPDVSKMRLFAYANDTINGGQRKVTIGIKSARLIGSSNLVLRTAVQVRKGAQLKFEEGAIMIAEHANESLLGSVKLTKGLNRNRFTLALRQFKVGDKSLFSSANLAGGVAATTANVEPSAATVLTNLTSFLNKKVKATAISQAQMDVALTRFNSTAAKAIIPSANLRAAVVSLVGTVAEPAIEFYLDSANSTKKTPTFVGFDAGQVGASAKVANLSYRSSGRLKVAVHPDYAGESFVVLSGRLAHEAMHDDSAKNHVNSQDEEVIANFVESTVYAQQVDVDYTYTRAGTKYVTFANYRLYLLLNSGDRQFPRVGIKQAPLKNSGGAAPGFDTDYNSAAVASFEQDVRNEAAAAGIADTASTATTAIGRAILSRITGDVYAGSTVYGDALIDSMDIGQDTLGDAFAMRVARVIQVKVY